jgi:uncharacterized protein YutE (UPF0331/DUF86 family)
MTEQEKISQKLESLGEYLRYLKMCRKYSLEELKGDPIIRGAVERYLHLAAECVIDIAEIMIATRGLRKPEDYREAIDILGEAEIIPAAFAGYFSPIAGFRNILVHEYARIDLQEVYRHLVKDLDDFEKFAQFIARSVEK